MKLLGADRESVDDRRMQLGPRLRQAPEEIVDLRGWELDQDNPWGMPGARPKRIFVCPKVPPHGFLIGGHRYLFKEPSGWRSAQIWSEAIAYELSRDLGLPVPPAFLARGPENGAPGILVEFFYGYPTQELVEKWRYVDAINLLQGFDYEINFKHGSLSDNLHLSRSLGIANWRDWWCRAIAFDALIGNGDRHSANWGTLIRVPTETHQRVVRLAPAFDNGSSLGYQQQDQPLADHLSAGSMDRLVQSVTSKGRHHLSWTGGNQGALHPELCREMRDHVRGGIGDSMNAACTLADDRIAAIVDWCTRFKFGVPFTEARAAFVARQLMARRDAITQALRT